MTLVADEQATQWFSAAPEEERLQVEVDTGVAHIARVYNYWLEYFGLRQLHRAGQLARRSKMYLTCENVVC
jgi:hypothetical protein